ncbi:uncharacterized protein MONBRDRAFT_10492 [Monosiga brevicollis MX1]|uniref:Major vault protein n=1 Tax=Monosiga brevicollis TaxID=81824 RepID=A9V6C9_MONBE|nr:uncharacterized protein MONBRDRAFT_10492 [Monosiga brevicollis MX1]EDQ86973.1 predicted protein [Monosiga brevicollis MX1]|eukprot:XP_001748212.1 hypothetical protein [Monosiga brevicollis MX1]
MAAKPNGDKNVFRVPPFHYLHVLDQNTNVTRVELGPMTFYRQDNEVVKFGPEKMVTVPPRHYCVVENPVARTSDGNVVYIGGTKQVKLRHAEQEVRVAQDPFPLFPGEQLATPVTPLTVVETNSALRLKAVLDFDDETSSVHRVAGDEWLFEGPGTYIPRVEVRVEELIKAFIIMPNQALRLRALKETTDRSGTSRVTGEEWLVKDTGAYLPGVFEEVLDVVNAYVLTEKQALHLRATRTFVDDLGTTRKTGEEWLMTNEHCDTHIPSVYSEVVALVDITTLTNRQYAVIVNPVDEKGHSQLGAKKLVKGPASFFLQPGETLEKGVQDVFVLGEDEGIILRAAETFKDTDHLTGKPVERKPGDRWMIRGPAEYVPSVSVEVVTQRKAIPLDENEGIYVRNITTGHVRAIMGKTYMLQEWEELCDKELPAQVEELLSNDYDVVADRNGSGGRRGGSGGAGGNRKRDKTRVVTYRVPHNACVQIYDYKQKRARVCYGPDLVKLDYDEQFTVLSLSGGKPKKPHQIKALALLLGPDFASDIITIETSDHTRLQLQLSYNWLFQVKDKSDQSEAQRLFSVPDFVGDMCKAVASRVRGAVAQVSFDDFHKNSAKIIRSAVFGVDEKARVRDKDGFVFPANNLAITSIDIQSAEPVDQRTREALQKSVQLAIEITTNSQEAEARHKAEHREQQAKGALERQKIQDEAQAEQSRKALLELQAESAAVESTGQAKAEAQSRAEANRIEGEAAVAQAKLQAEARRIEGEAELARLRAAREAELEYIRAQNELEVEKSKRLMDIETSKFANMVSAITPQTLAEMARAGPQMQAELLKGLGIQSTLITDGATPINLFNTASGLVGGALAKPN